MWSLPADENTLDKAKFISSPFCSYSSRCHRKNELSNYLLSVEVEGKVSVLMELASTSAKYRPKQESSIKREVFSLSLSDLCTKRLFCCWSSYEDLGPRRSRFQCWSEGNWHGKYLNCHFRTREVSKINENWDIYSILSLLAAFRFSLI